MNKNTNLMNFILYLSRKQENFMCSKDVKLKYLAEDEEKPYWFVDFEEHGGYPVIDIDDLKGIIEVAEKNNFKIEFIVRGLDLTEVDNVNY